MASPRAHPPPHRATTKNGVFEIPLPEAPFELQCDFTRVLIVEVGDCAVVEGGERGEMPFSELGEGKREDGVVVLGSEGFFGEGAGGPRGECYRLFLRVVG